LSRILLTNADISSWLPGDSLYDSSVYLPAELDPGMYELDLAIIDEELKPRVKLAVEGLLEDGWYHLGSVEVEPRAWKALGSP